jgi:hypothetical protein
MPPRLLVVFGLAFLAMLPVLCGCSSSHKRDQYFGTDAGANYQIPDAANFSSQEGADASAADIADDTELEAVPADASAQESGPGIES